MRRAVAEYRVLGITTNLALFGAVMRDEEWRAGQLDTGFLERFMLKPQPTKEDSDARLAAVLAAISFAKKTPREAPVAAANGVWLDQARRGLLR